MSHGENKMKEEYVFGPRRVVNGGKQAVITIPQCLRERLQGHYVIVKVTVID